MRCGPRVIHADPDHAAWAITTDRLIKQRPSAHILHSRLRPQIGNASGSRKHPDLSLYQAPVAKESPAVVPDTNAQQPPTPSRANNPNHGFRCLSSSQEATNSLPGHSRSIRRPNGVGSGTGRLGYVQAGIAVRTA